MSAGNKRLQLMGLIIAGWAVAGMSGCGGIGGTTVPVAGAVTLNGTPLPFALVVFHPQELGGREVAAVTDIRGRFDVRDGDRIGLPPGPYVVTVKYFVSQGDSPQRPEPDADFGDDSLKQLVADTYSDEAKSDLYALVQAPDPDTEDVPNVFNFDLEGSTVPLPSGAEPFGRGAPPPATDVPTPEGGPVGSPGGSLVSTDMLVYGGGGLIFLAVVGAVLFFFMRRGRVAGEDDGSAYQYDGEIGEDLEGGESPPPARPAPRRKKKRKKKKIRKRAGAADSDIGAPTLETAEPEAEPEDEFEGSPFPVLDEGMDDDDVAAAFLAGDDETIPAPKKRSEADVAKWMLGAGGFVKIQTEDKKSVTVKKPDDLPKGKFEIQGAFFEGVEDFGDDELAQIKKLPHLDTLDLISTNISDEGLAALEELPSIRTLALSRTAITDAGLEHLTALPNLRVLLLYRTHISDAGLETLKKLTKLKTVELKKTDMTAEAVKELQQQLPDCKVIA